jgi:hypothetical protein
MIKDIDAELGIDLVDHDWVMEVGEVLAFGMTKYPAAGWDRIPVSDHIYAAISHAVKHLRGDRIDSESGLSHLGHASTRLMFAYVVARKREYISCRQGKGK